MINQDEYIADEYDNSCAIAPAPARPEQHIELLGNKPTLADILRLERDLMALPNAVLELPVVHHHAPDLYARELHIPADFVLTGKRHKTAHLNVMLGDITVWTEDGMKRLTGYHAFMSYPGTKRVGYTHAPTVWTTFHPTKETDLAKIEAEVIDPTCEQMTHDEITAFLQEVAP